MTTDWGAMMALAARAGVAPEAFWRLSLNEWRMLTATPAQATPMGRGELKRLAEAWPDE